MNKPKNENYAGVVVALTSIIPLEGMNNVVHANIFGNLVIVGKDSKEGDVGIFFPIETQLSNKYLEENNLYRKQELNKDKTLKGYFEENGRIRAMKFAGKFKSMGLFMPLPSVSFALSKKEELKVGDIFDEINGMEICKKYFNPKNEPKGPNKTKQTKHKKVESKLIEKQWNFHIDTPQLGRTIHDLSPDDLCDVSTKIHGSSWISGKVLCKRKLNLFEKVLHKLGVNIRTEEYDYIWSSRRVVKNLNMDEKIHFYGEDLWGMVHEKVKGFLDDGITFYGEVVGQLPNGKWIQKDYDYGTNPGEFGIYFYRITHTNSAGKVFEWSMKQVRDFCKMNGLNIVPQLYYGTLGDWLNKRNIEWTKENFHEVLLKSLQNEYLEKDSVLCKNKVPEEGIVLRRESSEIDVKKLKAFRFFEEEGKQIDSGEVDMETEES
jgi:hypothetical protein